MKKKLLLCSIFVIIVYPLFSQVLIDENKINHPEPLKRTFNSLEEQYIYENEQEKKTNNQNRDNSNAYQNKTNQEKQDARNTNESSENSTKNWWFSCDMISMGIQPSLYWLQKIEIGADLFKLGLSFGKAYPYSKFGFGTTVIEINPVTISFCPVQLYYIPWMKIKQIATQPLDHEDSRYYYYDPSQTAYMENVRHAVKLSASATAWGERYETEEGYILDKSIYDLKYLNLRAEYVFYFALSKKVMQFYQMMSLSVGVNNFIFSDFGEFKYRPYLDLRLSLASFMTLF